jgi:hypothetical protein
MRLSCIWQGGHALKERTRRLHFSPSRTVSGNRARSFSATVLVVLAFACVTHAADDSKLSLTPVATMPRQELEDRTPHGPIQDNSFLVEEAYNQEDGVIQHISTFQLLTGSKDWVYTFTDEWPLRTIKHQFSLTFAGTRIGEFGGVGAGDTAINYRYQLRGSGETKVAIAPRLSLLIPSGNWHMGRGFGGTGLQSNLPMSFVFNRRLVSQQFADPQSGEHQQSRQRTGWFREGFEQLANLLRSNRNPFLYQSASWKTGFTQGLGDDVIGGVCPNELGIALHRQREWLFDSDVVFAFRDGRRWSLK